MPISLPSTATPLGLRSTYATDEENAAAAEAMQQESLQANTAFGRGLSRGLYQMPAGLADAAGQIVEPLSQPTAQPIFDWAAQQRAAAQQTMTPQDRLSYDQLQTPGDYANYIAGKASENLPNMLPAMVGGVAGRIGLRNAALSPFAKTAIGGSIAAFPQQMGEGVGALREDPTIMANTTPMQRLGASAGYGALTAPLESLPDSLLANRLMGEGAVLKNVFKDGFKATAKDAAKHLGAAVAESAATEGVPEALEQKAQQVMQSHFNPNRDTSKDEHDLKESFFGGWAAGGGSSAVGRGADVAWAQGRGATEAIRNLIAPKALPANLMNSDDQTIVGWDKQDDVQRNETAKGLADRILNSDAAQSMKDAAKSFYDKAANGASDAWSSLSQALSDNEHVQHATGRLDNFLNAVKKANGAAFGSEKFNAESSPEDQAMFDQFTQHLDPKGVAARDTEKKSDLFQGVKAALKSDSWHELPWHDLEDEFGTIGRATDAVVKMRENMVRAGQLEHDDEFGKLLEASTKDGQLGERAMMDVVHRYGKEYISRKPDDRELREMVRGIRNAMQGRSSMKPEMVKAFDAEMNKAFGEANAAKVMQALGPKNVDKTEFETDDGKGNITGDEVSQPKPRFVGSATKSALKAAGSNAGAKETIEDHGGFWRLDKQSAKQEDIDALKAKIAGVQDKIIAAKAKGRTTKQHSANLAKLNKQLEGMRTEEHVQKDRKRFNDLSASLRNGKGAEAHYVRQLSPLEYSEAAGIDKETVAKHLGVTVDELENHPARMLMVEQRQLEKDKLSLDHDDLANMTDRTTQATKNLPRSVDLKGDQAERVKAALKLAGLPSRVAMEAEGFEHGQKMDDKVANRLLNNWDHGGNGIFTVHTTGGKYKMSAQALIETIRKRAVGEMGDASAVKAFETGIGSIMSMDGFVKITVDNIWGRQQSPLKNKVVTKDDGSKKGVASAKFGQFGPYFKLEPGLLLNKAEEAATRKGSKAEKEDLALVKEYEDLEDTIPRLQKREEALTKNGQHEEAEVVRTVIEQKLSRMEEIEDQYNEIESARAMYSGEDQTEAVPGEKGATDKDATPTEHTDEKVQDYNDDGSHKHPPGRPNERGDRTQRLEFNGVTLHLRPGVRAKDLTGAARKLVSTARRMRELGIGATSDIALNLVGQAAAANKAGDTVARDALLAMASDKVVESIVDEMLIAQETKDRTRYAELKDLGAEHIALSKKYKANQEVMDGYAKSYLPFLGKKPTSAQAKKFEAAPERWSHHSQFLATLEYKTSDEILADGMMRKTRLEHLEGLGIESEKMSELIHLMREEQSLARDELRARKEGTKAQKIEEAEVGSGAAPTQDATESLKLVADLQKDLADNLKQQRAIEAKENPTAADRKELSALKMEESGIHNDIAELSKEVGNKTSIAVRSTESANDTVLPSSREISNAKYVEGKKSIDDDNEYQKQRRELDKAEAEREAKAEPHQQAFKQALSDVEKLKKNLGDTGTALRAAYAALKQSYIDGKVSKDLVPQLRAALAAFRKAAGDAARIVVAAVQRFIKEYQEAGNGRGRGRGSAHSGNDNGVHETSTGDAGSTQNRGGSENGSTTQNNSEGSQPTGQPVTKQDMAEIKDYITKVLGPKVELRLSKNLGGNSASWVRKPNGEALIKIAINAANPLSKAHHEAMHEFFQRLMDDGSPAAEVLRTAANNPLVTRQIEQFFHKDANYAAIKAALAADEHERVAYMFQLWASGQINIGPKAQSWFQKIANFLREVSGVLSNDQKAEAIMAHFHDGKMADSNAVAEVLANDPKLVRDLIERSDDVMSPLAEKAKALLYTSQNMLTESGNKTFEKIGRLFSTETGQQGEAMSFFDAKTMKTNQMNDRLWKILKKSDGKDVALALEMLQQGGVSNDAKVEAIRKEIRKMLDEMHTYATAKGVKIKKVANYFPRAWDSIAIAENKAEFIELLRADHLKNGKGELDLAVAIGIANQLVDNRGAEPLHESELENGYSPFMAAANKRVLDFITSPEFSKFQEKSLEHILTNYVSQLVHKAEYTERFGANGTKLRDMVQDGVGEAVGPEWAEAKTKAQDKLAALKERLKSASPEERSKAMVKGGYRYGEIGIKHITDELTSQLARDKFQGFEPKLRNYVRSIMAMEGTLGADINPKLRKLSSSLIVYENMRLLSMSLFSQVIDPLGVLVRGGTVSDAFDTFKRGVGGTIAAWKGTPLEDSISNLAMQLGIVDAGGFLNSQADAYASVFLGKAAKKWNDRLFRWNGVEGFSQGTRVGAMVAAINFIKAHSTLPTEHSERWLAELNLKASDIKLDANGELDYFDPKIQQAIFRWVETAILRPNASMRPAWASDPHWSLIFHMKQFTYAMQKVLLERVHNEVKHGNLDPAIGMVLTYVPAMMAADFLRGLAANGGEEPPWKRKWKFSDYLSDGVQRAGLLGVPQFALDVQKWGPGELAGPAGEQVIRTAEQFHKDVARDHALDMRAALSGLPKDIQKAQTFNGVEHAAKKTLRDALPVNSLVKHYLYDEVVGKP